VERRPDARRSMLVRYRQTFIEFEVLTKLSENFFKNVDKDQEDFRNAVRIYEEDAKPKYKVGVELSETHSIDDVMTAIEATMKIYNEKAEKGMYAPLRRAFQKIGNYQACQSWIQLAPTQSAYFSLVCGGVMLLLEVFKAIRFLQDPADSSTGG
jgi:hypothetical protein